MGDGKIDNDVVLGSGTVFVIGMEHKKTLPLLVNAPLSALVR